MVSEIRTIDVSSLKHDPVKMEQYKRMFEENKKTFGLRQCVVLLGDLKNLNRRKFRPSIKMATFLLYASCKKVSIALSRISVATHEIASAELVQKDVHNKKKSPKKRRRTSLTRNRPLVKKHHIAATPRQSSTSSTALNIFGKNYEKQVYKCKHCREVFQDELKYKRHTTVHMIKKVELGAKQLHSCYICRKNFSERKLLWMHMRSHSGDNTASFKCKDCQASFRSNRDLDLHKSNCPKRNNVDVTVPAPPAPREREANLKYRCHICLKKFQDLYQMRLHKESHITSTSQDFPSVQFTNLRCDICDDVCDNYAALNEHYQFHKELEKSTPDQPEMQQERTVNQINISLNLPTVDRNASGSADEQLVTIRISRPELSSRRNSSFCNTISPPTVDAQSQIAKRRSSWNHNNASDDRRKNKSGSSTPDLQIDENVDPAVEENWQRLQEDVALSASDDTDGDSSTQSEIVEATPHGNVQEVCDTTPIEIDRHDEAHANAEATAATIAEAPRLPRIFVKKIQDLMPPSHDDLKRRRRSVSDDDCDKLVIDLPDDAKKTKKVKRPDSYKCDECKMVFKKGRSFRKHIRVAKTRHRCSMCSYTTCSFSSLKMHYRTVHGVKSICYKCKTSSAVIPHVCVKNMPSITETNGSTPRPVLDLIPS